MGTYFRFPRANVVELTIALVYWLIINSYLVV